MSNFECLKCGKTFCYKKNYDYHVDKNVCRKFKKFECEICGSSYKQMYNLRRHIMKLHSIHKCDVMNHVKINDFISKDYIKCSICGKNFVNNSSLNRHLKSCLSKKKNKINIAEINNNHINGNNNQLTNNNNNYDVKFNINNFGNEDPVERGEMIKLMKRTNVFNIEDLFLKYVFMKHVKNENNRNLFVERKTGETLFVLCDNVWKRKQKEDTFNLIKIGTIDDIDNFMNNNSEFKSEIVGSELDKLEHQNKKKFYKGVNEMLFNKKELLGLAYEKANKT